jgi:hypothetical protein
MSRMAIMAVAALILAGCVYAAPPPPPRPYAYAPGYSYPGYYYGTPAYGTVAVQGRWR